MQKFAAAIVALAGAAQANYLSGEVRSQDWFKYGKFVAKMQNPGKMGTVQSLFTYTAQDWPHGWNEIDVEIVPSVTENPYSMNIIWKDGEQDHNYATGFHPGTDWFTYSVEWTPEYVSWYVNDKLVRKSEGTEDVHFLSSDVQLMMNFWTPTWSPWNDYFDDAEMPWYAKYDYVEIYDYDLSSKDFKLRWRDDFDKWDEEKWYASDNWGFENNSSLFMASQVYVQDGHLVLKMDYNDGRAREFPLHHEIIHHEEPIPDHPHQKAIKTPHEMEGKVVHTTVIHHDTPHVIDPHAHFESFAQKPSAPAAPKAAAPAQPARPVAAHPDAKPHADEHLQDLSQRTVVMSPHHHSPVVDVHQYAVPDASRFEAPVIHQRSFEETGYPQHYSEADFETISHQYDSVHHGFTHGEHDLVYTRPFKDGHSEGDYGAKTYQSVKYEPTGYPTFDPARQVYHSPADTKGYARGHDHEYYNPHHSERFYESHFDQ